MNAITYVLRRVFVLEFFKSNATPLLFVIGIAVGFMRAPDHIALGEIVMSNVWLIGIPGCIWLVVALRIAHFNHVTLRLPASEFLYQLFLLPKKKQWLSLTVMIAQQFSLAWAYGIFLIALGIREGRADTVLGCIVLLLALQSMIVVSFLRKLSQPNAAKSVSLMKLWLDQYVPRRYPLMVLEWIVRKRTVLFMAVKIFSMILLYGVLALYSFEKYDVRLLAMGIAAAMASHASIVYEYHRFENFHFVIVRQLPFSFRKRWLWMAVIFLIIIFPEIGLVVTTFPSYLDPNLELISCVLMMLSILYFLYAMHYVRDRGEEKMMTLAFWFAMSVVVIILFALPVLIISISLIVASTFLWRRYYFRFEYLSEAE